jgi:glyoxylase-like metal-dependent hydrolase (beta-lactamase superfamily II)
MRTSSPFGKTTGRWRATTEGQGDFHLARAALAAYGDRVRTVKTDEVAPGVRAFPTPGHTPGHTAWLIESQGDGLLIWGDIVHFPGMQFAFSDTSVAYDIDAAAAAEERKKVLKFVAGEKLRVAGVHLDFPAFGHVVPNGAAYRYVPEVWRPTHLIARPRQRDEVSFVCCDGGACAEGFASLALVPESRGAQLAPSLNSHIDRD